MIITKVLNCTPHSINIITDDKVLAIEPSGICPRCTQNSEHVKNVFLDNETINIVHTVFGEVHDLPDKQDNTIIIVSALVANACPDRDDLVIPNDLVRDENGAIIGCRSLAMV